MTKSRLAVAAWALTAVCVAAELPKAPPAPRPDNRFKADILIFLGKKIREVSDLVDALNVYVK